MFEPERALLSFARRRVRLALGVGEERRVPRCLCAAPRPGSPFLWVLSFGEAKESTPTAVREPQLQFINIDGSREARAIPTLRREKTSARHHRKPHPALPPR